MAKRIKHYLDFDPSHISTLHRELWQHSYSSSGREYGATLEGPYGPIIPCEHVNAVLASKPGKSAAPLHHLLIHSKYGGKTGLQLVRHGFDFKLICPSFRRPHTQTKLLDVLRHMLLSGRVDLREYTLVEQIVLKILAMQPLGVTVAALIADVCDYGVHRDGVLDAIKKLQSKRRLRCLDPGPEFEKSSHLVVFSWPDVNEDAGMIDMTSTQEEADDTESASDVKHDRAFMKAAKAQGLDDNAAGLLKLAAAPYATTSVNRFPTGPTRAIVGSVQQQLSIAKPSSLPAGTWTFAGGIQPIIVRCQTGQEEPTYAKDLTKISAYMWRLYEFIGRTSTTSSLNAATAITNSDVFHDAWMVIVAGITVSPDPADWSSYNADQFFAFQLGSNVINFSNTKIVGASLKATNTTPNIAKGGLVSVARAPARLEPRNVTTSGSVFESGVAKVDYTNVSTQLVTFIPRWAVLYPGAPTLQFASGPAEHGFLTVAPTNYRRNVVPGSASVSLVGFEPRDGQMASGFWQTESEVAQGLRCLQQTAECDSVDAYNRSCFIDCELFSDISVSFLVTGQQEEATWVMTGVIKLLTYIPDASDPLNPFACTQLPFDGDLLDAMTRASYSSALLEPSSHNSLGIHLGDLARKLPTIARDLAPVAKMGLSLASQLPGPAGYAAQQADKIIKTVEHVRDGAKAARRKNSAAGRLAKNIESSRGGEANRVDPLTRPKSERVKVRHTRDGGLDLKVPKGRM